MPLEPVAVGGLACLEVERHEAIAGSVDQSGFDLGGHARPVAVDTRSRVFGNNGHFQQLALAQRAGNGFDLALGLIHGAQRTSAALTPPAAFRPGAPVARGCISARTNLARRAAQAVFRPLPNK